MDRKTRYYSGMSSNKGTARQQLLLTYWMDSEQVTSENTSVRQTKQIPYGDAPSDIASITVVIGGLRISHFVINKLLYITQGKCYRVVKTQQKNIKMYSPGTISVTTEAGEMYEKCMPGPEMYLLV